MTQTIKRDDLPERKQSLADLVKKATAPYPLETTDGQLLVKRLSLGTMDKLDELVPRGIEKHAADLERLGARVVQSHVSKPGEDGLAKALSEAQVRMLPEEDLQSIAQKFADINEFKLQGAAGALGSLGGGVFDELARYRKQTESQAAHYTGAFAGISESVKESLAVKLAGLDSMRSYLDDNFAVAEMARKLNERHDFFEQSRLDEERLLNSSSIQFPSMEDGPMGRAALAGEDAAAQLREVAALTGQMVSDISKVSETMITEVFPTWFASLKDDAQATRESAKQSQSNLFWAKWALVASVLATLGTAAWQVWLSSEYERESDNQQATIERLMREQVEQSNRLIALQEAHGASMKEFLSRSKEARAAMTGAQELPTKNQGQVER